MQIANPEADMHLLFLPCPQEAIFLCLDPPGASCPATRDHPYSPKPTEMIQTSRSRLLTLPCFACPSRSPLLSSASWPPWCPSHVALRGMPRLLSVGPVSLFNNVLMIHHYLLSSLSCASSCSYVQLTVSQRVQSSLPRK